MILNKSNRFFLLLTELWKIYISSVILSSSLMRRACPEQSEGINSVEGCSQHTRFFFPKKSGLRMTHTLKAAKLQLLIFLLVWNSRFISSPLFAQEKSPAESGVRYYLQLQQEEFERTMIPKEQFLLGIVQNVHQEINDRRSEGVSVSDLGIGDVISPDELVLDAFDQELRKITGLLEEIASLERLAKRKVNLEVLETLSRLKNQVREIVEGRYASTRSEQAPQASEQVEMFHVPSDTDDVISEDVALERSFEDSSRTRDLFEQWKYNRLLDYKVKYTEYEFLRTKLLQTATPIQERRMFQRDLRWALDTYSAGDFLLARLQLQDILDTYARYKFLDDVLYYCSESSYGLNYFDEALEGYYRLVYEYPESSFCAKALTKIIYIYYIYGEFDKLREVYEKLLTHKTSLDLESFSTVSYLLGYAHFSAGKYDNALHYLTNVSYGSTYFFPSLYLSAACYSNVGKDDLAFSIYQRLIEEENKGNKDAVLSQIQNNALLKLGLIYYDQGDNKRATDYFNRVSKNFQYYDLSVIGKAWSAYRSGKPGEVLRNVEWLLRNAMVSNYAYEARVLAASAKELLGHSEEAIEDLKEVYRIGSRSKQETTYPSERGMPSQDTQNMDEYEAALTAERDLEILSEIEQIRQFLQSATPEGALSGSRQGAPDQDFSEQKQILSQKIKTLDQLEIQARENGNPVFLAEIRRLRSDLLQALQNHTQQFSETFPDPASDPLIRKMGMSEYLKYLFQSLLTQTLREKDQTKKNIQEANVLLEEARNQEKFEFAVRMEIRKEELNDYYGILNQYEIWLRENFPKEARVELDRWASFSGYGISNINFSRIKESERRIAEVSQTIETLDRVFQGKRKELESRIQDLLSDVTTIEEQMRLEAAKREEKERERFFEADYFERQKQESAAGRLYQKPESKEKGKVKK